MTFNLGRLEAVYRLQHRHDDGEWREMRPHHSPADHDPERSWERGVVFQCTTCEETATIIPGELEDRGSPA
ncbi:MAG TPA: hypothetical protein VGQ47_02950 [Candidatus Limnocylindrales bacterium]|jgi:hypothetical protein|nr:hypothetical protein [Candidatus Limnocylindrales bacterium]